MHAALVHDSATSGDTHTDRLVATGMQSGSNVVVGGVTIGTVAYTDDETFNGYTGNQYVLTTNANATPEVGRAHV